MARYFRISVAPQDVCHTILSAVTYALQTRDPRGGWRERSRSPRRLWRTRRERGDGDESDDRRERDEHSDRVARSRTVPPDAASFEADLVHAATADHPPRFATTLTNAGNKAFTVTFGFAPPFSVATLDAVDGDASLFCYPVAPEARQHVRAVAQFGENTTDSPDLPLKSRTDGCWRFTGSYTTDVIAYQRTLDAGESLRVAYDVYTYGDGPCLPDGDYRATNAVTAFPGTSADGPETKWTYDLTLACCDGSVTNVAGSDVREVALTDG